MKMKIAISSRRNASRHQFPTKKVKVFAKRCANIWCFFVQTGYREAFRRDEIVIFAILKSILGSKNRSKIDFFWIGLISASDFIGVFLTSQKASHIGSFLTTILGGWGVPLGGPKGEPKSSKNVGGQRHFENQELKSTVFLRSNWPVVVQKMTKT